VYRDSHILVYPIPSSDGDVSAGNRMINFVWYRNYAEGDELNDVLTDRSGNRRDISVPPGHVAVKHVEELRSTAQRVLPEILSSVIQHTPEPFIQVIYDIEVEKMVFGRICLLGDAAFAVRPHAAAGTAKASDDGWALDTAIRENKNLDDALRSWETQQLTVGSRLLARTRRIGSRSQFENNWDPTDPELIFGLHKPGD
jgi:2,6-dihydroxypyridine 3-monooxygenase